MYVPGVVARGQKYATVYNIHLFHIFLCFVQAKQPQGFVFWINVTIITVFSIGGLLAAIGSIREIAMHAQTYDLFH